MSPTSYRTAPPRVDSWHCSTGPDRNQGAAASYTPGVPWLVVWIALVIFGLAVVVGAVHAARAARRLVHRMGRLQEALGSAQVELAAKAERLAAAGEAASAGAERLNASTTRLQGSLQAAGLARGALAEGGRPLALLRRELGG
jgi:hypothetical protein